MSRESPRVTYARCTPLFTGNLQCVCVHRIGRRLIPTPVDAIPSNARIALLLRRSALIYGGNRLSGNGSQR